MKKKVIGMLVTVLFTLETAIVPALAETVVIDPGHGGYDSGAAYYGLKEKDLNLDISQRLKELLEQENLDVVMTRDDDRYLTLKERAEIINAANASFYVSIHNNAHPDKSVSGTQFFYYDVNDPKTNTEAYAPHAGAVANSASNKLAAQIMQRNLLNSLGTKDKGYLAGNLYVTRNSAIPGALAEIAFMSNESDAKKLSDPNFLQQAAVGLKNGILEFINNYVYPFTDIANHWSKDDIKALNDVGIVNGENGKYYPQRNITRMEIAALLVRALEQETVIDVEKDLAFVDGNYGVLSGSSTENVVDNVYGENITEEEIFNDVSSQHWGFNELKKAKDYELVGGYKDGSFKPDNLVSRAEVATMIGRYIDKVQTLKPQYAAVTSSKTVTETGVQTDNTYNQGQGYNLEFTDVKGHWASNSIYYLAQLGITNGYKDGTFRPAANATRGEIASILRRSMEHNGIVDFLH